MIGTLRAANLRVPCLQQRCAEKGEAVMPAEYIYIGVRKTDGSIRAVCCDDVGEEKDTAKMVADWVARGLSVERITQAEYSRRISTMSADK